MEDSSQKLWFLLKNILFPSFTNLKIFLKIHLEKIKKSCHPGLEPRISCSVGTRLIHWASGTSVFLLKEQSVIIPRIYKHIF